MPGPLGNDFGNVFLSHLFSRQGTTGRLQIFQVGFGILQLLLQLGEFAVLQFSGFVRS